MRISYAPGEWNVVVRSGTLIVLPPDTGRSGISGIWEALAESRNLEVALRAVTKAFDADVTSMPPFAIASLQNRLHVMVRGQITIRSRNGQSETEISGAHVTTWNEQVLHDQHSLDISFDEATLGEPPLPLEAGAVRAAGVVISLTESTRDQEDTTSTGGPRQPSWGSGGDQTINPTDLDVYGDDEGPAGAGEPAETDDLDLVDDTSSAAEESRQARANNTAGTGSGLIESVPWMKSGPGSSPPRAGSAEPEPASAEPDPASAAPELAEPDSAAPAFDDEIDHDGHTVMRSELNAPPASGSSTGGTDGTDGTDAAGTRGPSTAPIVLARMCPSGHANPPTNANCSTCGSPITSDPCQARRPSLGSMRMSNGEMVELDRSVIVGRQPSMSRVQGNVMPRMVQVHSGEGDISRSHVEVQLEGWHVMLRDLNSTNGTFLIREGQPPRRLAQGEQAMLLDGDVAELGDDVWLRFEGLK